MFRKTAFVCCAFAMFVGGASVLRPAIGAEKADRPRPREKATADGERGGGRMGRLAGKLELTDAQRDEVKQIIAAHRQEIATVAKPLVDAGRTLKDATKAEPSDEKAIRAAAANVGKALGDAAMVASKVKVEVRAVLTPDQQAKLDEMGDNLAGSVDAIISRLGEAAAK